MTRRQTLKGLKTTSLLNVYHGKNRGVLPLAGSHRKSDCDWRNIVTWLNPIGVQISRIFFQFGFYRNDITVPYNIYKILYTYTNNIAKRFSHVNKGRANEAIGGG